MINSSRLDVIDPQRNITTRLKLNYIDESFISTLKVHADVLKESFFEKIELIEDEEDGEMQLNVQQLPLPQVLTYSYLIGQNFGGQNFSALLANENFSSTSYISTYT